jgi:two-component system alkaline phosphatase synthesis response regulator PhoP
VKTKILIIEDEAHLAQGLKLHLELASHQVIWARDGVEGVDQWREHNPDLVILDLMMPRKDGLQVLEEIRAVDDKLPILILSARSAIQDRIKALKKGVDDYLAKPFDSQELLLRVDRLLLKRGWLEQSGEINLEEEEADTEIRLNEKLKKFSFGDNVIDFTMGTAKTALGLVVALTDQELKLLRLFASYPNRPLSRKDLLKVAWGYAQDMETRTLDNFIVRFRKYFEPDAKRPKYFQSVRSVGYVLKI